GGGRLAGQVGVEPAEHQDDATLEELGLEPVAEAHTLQRTLPGPGTTGPLQNGWGAWRLLAAILREELSPARPWRRPMAKARPDKKPAESPARRILPTELQVGDR